VCTRGRKQLTSGWLVRGWRDKLGGPQQPAGPAAKSAFLPPLQASGRVGHSPDLLLAQPVVEMHSAGRGHASRGALIVASKKL